MEKSLNMTTFLLHPQIESDSIFITDMKLCQVRLHKNAAFPWIMLIPKVNVIEVVDMKSEEQQKLMQEICIASTVMRRLYNPTKLNIATIGNVVSQIHVHVVARYDTDKAWPKTVWYCGVEEDYSKENHDLQVSLLQRAFQDMESTSACAVA